MSTRTIKMLWLKNLMQHKFVIVFTLSLLTFLGYEIYTYQEYTCDDETRAHAKKKAEDQLKSLNRSKGYNLDPALLFEDRVRDKGCDLSFVQRQNGPNIHFVVIGGYKVTWWDCISRGDCEHLKIPNNEKALPPLPVYSINWDCREGKNCETDNLIQQP